MRGIYKESEVGILDTAASVHTEDKKKAAAPRDSKARRLQIRLDGCLYTDLGNFCLSCVPDHGRRFVRDHMFIPDYRLSLCPLTPYGFPSDVPPLVSSSETITPFGFSTVQ